MRLLILSAETRKFILLIFILVRKLESIAWKLTITHFLGWSLGVKWNKIRHDFLADEQIWNLVWIYRKFHSSVNHKAGKLRLSIGLELVVNW